MNLAKRKLGLMVSTGPEHANLDTAVGLGAPHSTAAPRCTCT